MNQVYVSLDLEMTSAQPDNQEVIEIGCVKFRGNRVVDTWSTLVNPGVPIPLNIQVLTGIRNEDVARAPKLADVAGQLRAFVQDLPLVAHTISSDVGCLQRKGISLDNPQLDTYELSTVLLPQVSNYSLAALAEQFDISFPHKHRAAADALVTKHLYVKLWEAALALDPAILQEINRLIAPTMWPFREFFRQAEVEKNRQIDGMPSIRQRLAARAGEGLPIELLLYESELEPPLEAPDEPAPIDVEDLVRRLEPGGVLERELPGFEHRPPQVEMLRAVSAALNDGKHLMVEAGTGTGKSLAYLLPAIVFATKNRERIVISTNTINLQDQLHAKDLPDLSRILPEKFRWTLVKGRSNYLCLSRLTALRRRTDLSLSEILTLVKILVWLPNTQTGDVTELNLTEDERHVWSRLNATHEVCTPQRCAHHRRGTCFLARARRTAESCHVVIVNHALLLSDIATSSKVLPEYRYLVVDEAHHVESEATERLAYEVRQRQVLGLLDELAPAGGGDRASGVLSDAQTLLHQSKASQSAIARIQNAGEGLPSAIQSAREATLEFFAALTQLLKQGARDNRGYEQRLRLVQGVRKSTAWQAIPVAWERVALRLIAVGDYVNKLLALLSELEDHGIPDHDVLLARVQAMLSFIEEFRVQGSALIDRPDAGRIYWISGGDGSDVGFHSAPLHVGELLQSSLFEQKRCVVLTSATLATAGRFDYMQERLSLDVAHTLAVGSPFDYEASTLLCIPSDISEPEAPSYLREAQQVIINLCTATQGRTLVLFTSHSQLRQVYQGIHRPLAERGILVLGHGIGGSGRRHLLQTFKTNPRTVLLGAASFWEGVDVVGDALSVLVITRLPFNVPSDPVFAARSELFDDPFNQYGLPQTILRFKQGFGRLIRSKSDRGVVVVLDRRIQTKAYGATFLKSLPPCTQRTMPMRALAAEAKRWLSVVPELRGSELQRS